MFLNTITTIPNAFGICSCCFNCISNCLKNGNDFTVIIKLCNSS